MKPCISWQPQARSSSSCSRVSTPSATTLSLRLEARAMIAWARAALFGSRSMSRTNERSILSVLIGNALR